MLDKELVHGSEGFRELFVAMIFLTSCEDAVGVFHITCHYVFGSVAGGFGEAPHLVG